MKTKKRLTRFLLTSILFLVFVVAILPWQQTAGELFEKALYLEEAQGDLQKAIELYKMILKDFPANREISAKAMLHMGFCFEKLGLQQAQKTYQQVVDEFPEQRDTVELAKEKLSIFQKTEDVLATSEMGFSIRKVLSDTEATGLGRVSSDGKYFTKIDWDNGNLLIVEMKTGKEIPLTDKKSWYESGAMAFNSRWSPDDKFIVFDWWDWDSEPNFVGLKVIRPDGSGLKDFYKVQDQGNQVTIVNGWSQDGKFILAQENSRDNTAQIITLSYPDGKKRILKTLDMSRIRYNSINNMCLSPDGMFVAYDFPGRQKSPNRDIYILSLDGKIDAPFIEHQADDRLLGWTPDGKSLLFASDRRGSFDIWLAAVDKGYLQSAPEMIKSSLGPFDTMGMTKSGSFYYAISRNTENVYIADFDPINRKVKNQPQIPISHLGKSTHSPAYSHDGRYLAYVSMRGIGNNTSFVICIRDLKDNSEREIYEELNFHHLKWSPDDKYVLAIASDKQDRMGHQLLASIDVDSGDAIILFRCEKPRMENQLRTPNWNMDGTGIFYVLNEVRNKVCRLMYRDMKSGAEKELFRETDYTKRFTISCSPDGEWLSIFSYKGGENKNRTIQILSTKGGSPRVLHSFTDTTNWVVATEWSLDSKYVFFPKSRREDIADPKSTVHQELWCIPVAGGEPQSLGLKMVQISQLSPHPDGKHFVFCSRGPEYKQPELWVMENFLPGSQSKIK